MNKKQKYIKLDKEKVKEIAEIKNVSTVTVYAALKFQTQSSLAMLIRAWALNNGGVLFEEKENHYSEVKPYKDNPMNYANYSLKNLEAQLDHVCELMELIRGDRKARDAFQDEEYCYLLKMQAMLFEEIRKRTKSLIPPHK